MEVFEEFMKFMTVWGLVAVETVTNMNEVYVVNNILLCF
jgi:hypothetical protein